MKKEGSEEKGLSKEVLKKRFRSRASARREEKARTERGLQKKPTREERLLRELQANHAVIETRNEELRHARRVIKESRRKYSDLYDFAPVGYFTFDRYGMIEETNLTGAGLLGVERSRLIGKPFILFIVEEDHDLFRAHRTETFRTGMRRVCEIRMNRGIDHALQKRIEFDARLESVPVEEGEGRWRLRTVLSDISVQKKAGESGEAHQILEAVFKAAPLAIYILDPEGKVKRWNPAAERIFGWREEEVVGKPLPTVQPEKEGEFRRIFNDLLCGETFTGLEVRRRRKNGETVDLSISTALLRDPSGEIRGAMALVEDIADRKRAEAEIEAMNEELRRKNTKIQEAVRARNRFFSYISHELKTPLNSIVGFTQLMRSGTYGELTREQSRALARVQSNAGDLVQLINNILDLARMELGKITPKMMEINVAELVEKIAAPFEPFLREKDLHLRVRIDPFFPKVFWTDPTKIRSILTNLLSNAVKFTDRGEIGILLDPLPDRSGIRLIISDSGVGIDRDDLKRLFQDFERTEIAAETASSYTRGTGLGLAIVRRMISSLQGKIDVESAVGRGTRFRIELPNPEAIPHLK